jgi:hypothetical protein
MISTERQLREVPVTVTHSSRNRSKTKSIRFQIFGFSQPLLIVHFLIYIFVYGTFHTERGKRHFSHECVCLFTRIHERSCVHYFS